MKLTLFLGAGFSAAFGHPVMDSFLEFTDTCDRLTNDDRGFLDKLVLEARRANSFLESSPTNLEDILSFSEMGERLGLTDPDENRGNRLREIILRVFTTTPPAREYWSRFSVLRDFLGADLRDFKGELSFITTNYDLNIESACLSLRSCMNPGFVLSRVGRGRVQVAQKLYDPTGIPLYKLHGSVNWYEDGNSESGLVVDDQVVYVRSFEDEGPQTLPSPCTSNYKTPGVPVMVPPSFLKPNLKPTLAAVWSGAAKSLSEATVVAFIGYSFPSSDTEMMYFLARALSGNAGLRAVYLIDPNADAIASRLRAAGSKTGSHFKGLLKPIADPWNIVKLPL